MEQTIVYQTSIIFYNLGCYALYMYITSEFVGIVHVAYYQTLYHMEPLESVISIFPSASKASHFVNNMNQHIL